MKREPPLCKLTFRAPRHVRQWLDEHAREVMRQLGEKSLTRARGIVLMEVATAYIARRKEAAMEATTKPA